MGREHWHQQPVDAVLAALGSTLDGLSDDEAARRLAQHGPNRLPAPPRTSALAVLRDQFRSVVVILLIAAAAVSLLLGDGAESLAIAAVLVINTAIGFATEFRARRVMEAILRLDAPRASVLRSGQLRVIEARGLVPGDIIVLDAGHQVPADARLVETAEFRANEAALTGESLPASKRAAFTLPADTPLADRANMVYSGTTVVAGLGRAIVTATGRGTEVGRIGELTGSVVIERTPLERRLDALGHRLVWLALGVAALVAGLGALQGAPVALIVQTGIALAVAAVPEALPAVATIALGVGMHRMAARNALVRRLPVVESLGSTTVICTDKTRTLTSGDMALVRVWAAGREVDLSSAASPDDDTRRLLEIAVLASRLPASDRADGTARLDPVDRAIVEAARRSGIEPLRLANARPEVGLVPFSSDRKLMASFRQTSDGLVAHVKGAPARVLALCALDTSTREALIAVNNALANQGLRILAAAAGPVREPREDALTALTFAGFLGLADPPAPGVKETIARLRAAGLRTIMLTGDQRLTAEAVGRELGLLRAGEHVIEGRDMETLTGARLVAAVADAGAFSRIAPEHKLRIVEALQARGEIVAMLGDGINDAPALRKADVGVAMGTRGTDVAKEAAAIVLRDDRFETIAAAVEQGRVIFDNIRKFVFYLFSCNVAEVLVLLIAGLAGLPLPLLPLQLLWLNMITDTFPALALALEPAERDVMRRPPRKPDEEILSRAFVTRITLYGGLITIPTLAAFLWGLTQTAAHARTMAFLTLALAQIAHLGNARRAGAVLSASRIASNPYAIGAVVLSAGLQIAAAYVEPLPELLGIVSLGGVDWAIVTGLAAIPAVVGQAIKMRHPHL